MRFEDIRKGETYRIRQWDDMAAEFGTNGAGDIPCAAVFVKSMSGLCGTEVVVQGWHNGYEYKVLHVRPVSELPDFESIDWTITADMLEPVYEEELPDVDPASIFDLLGG